MKKIIFTVLLLLMPLSVNADTIYNIDMKIDILKDGYANIVEEWTVKADGGSEWYKTLYNLGNSELSSFVVYMDGNKLNYKNWNIDDSLKEKAGYYGINTSSDGIELCFGKSDMNKHVFTLNYTLSNYIFNTDDSQVLYWTLMPKITVSNFSVEVSSYYDFPDDLDVWGYGYKGYAYVDGGKIKMSNEGMLSNDYIVLLAKFPLNTFNTTNSYFNFNSFEDVYNTAEENTFDYDYTDSYSNYFVIDFFLIVLYLFIFLIPFVFIFKKSDSYGYKDNKKINKKEVPLFREIPCNKDIYYANTLIKMNEFGYNKTNILGAIILKWIKNDKIGFKNEVKGIFNKETSSIDLTMNPTFDNVLEKELFDMMYEASKDGILETKEFEKWCRKHYSKFFKLFDRIELVEIEKLKLNNHIYKRKDKNECKKKNVMDDIIYNDSIKLCGLKKFLQEFSKIDTKEVLEVKLWDEYLMFAYLFGIADKVAKQLKNLYPEILEQYDFDYGTLLFINNISTRSVSAASSARSAAQSYSSGGGGFSSGGGGGGSFGGGGSAGGR